MQDKEREVRFLTGLSRIVKACRQEVDDVTLEVYTEALCPMVQPDEWDAFTLAAVRSGRWTWFPKVSEMLDALREFQGAPVVEFEAGQAYERVCEAGTYAAEGGTFWSYRAVKEACGSIAAEAFVAAGGNHAFASTWNESKRREAFVAAYLRAARETPAGRLLPAGSTPAAIPAPPEPEISQGEAWSALEKLKQYLPEGVEVPTPRPTMTAQATPERLAELRAQAEKLLAEEGSGDGVLA
jgi:hypothetical protein